MNLRKKKRMIASLYGVGRKRVRLEPEALDEVKGVITKADSRGLVKRGVVVIKQKQGHSRSRAREKIRQKRKGRHKGHGSRKGTHSARLRSKQVWMNSIRTQRRFMKELREKGLITTSVFREIYLKAKGGFFRSRRHIKIYLEEHGMISGSKNKEMPSKLEPKQEKKSGHETESGLKIKPKQEMKPKSGAKHEQMNEKKEAKR